MKQEIRQNLVRSTLVSICLVGAVHAMPPTEDAIRHWIAEGVYEQKIANWTAFKEAGGCAPNEHSPLNRLREARGTGLAADAVDTLRVICILVEFTDWRASGQNIYATPNDFDSLLRGRPQNFFFGHRILLKLGIDSYN